MSKVNKKMKLFDEDTMKKAVFKVVKRGCSIRGVAAKAGLSYATLRKYVVKYNSTKKENRKSLRFSPNYEVNQIFSKELEESLERYLLIARKLHYGLTSDIIKRLSFELAVKNDLKVPNSWARNQKAGKHWLYGYLKRHPTINDILSWSRKFRPPIKKQYNTTLELAHKSTGEATHDDIEEIDAEETEDFDESQSASEVPQPTNPVIIIPLKKTRKV